MTDTLGEHDEVFHAPTDNPHWGESGWFGFNIPERNLNGFVYYFHDARTGTSGGGPALWDPSGEEIYDCLFYDWRWHQPPTGPLEFSDFTLPNSLRHEVVEPLHRYRLSYSQPGLEFELDWTGLMPPHEFGTVRDPAIPTHFDQPGHMQGTLVLNGEQLTVDCLAMRDRTWGPHVHEQPRSGDYLWAIASPESHWHSIAINVGEPGVDIAVGGYLARDGKVGEIVKGERRVTQRSDGAPVRVTFDAQDDLGRELHAVGQVRTALRWMGWPGRLTYWTLTEWTWDNQTGFGENQEFIARDDVRALLAT
ncbi:hypothetical protein FHT44_001295 [Mycolicibacterium sp. BK634]|uniref:DUF7064 domain-containing protein n=1 Tax=Mycobacteriaceae TaxID=1762 RepID=UPI0010D3D66E|nr:MULTISPECIES: hypothetical protein [Mycobacteriaceae]MBB3748834.1 hypothetical protein [Mycolicibacterium sp. BK634]TDO14952.1 hypothetical protein EV580_3090 [Mycobacterium sp. BK086]